MIGGGEASQIFTPTKGKGTEQDLVMLQWGKGTKSHEKVFMRSLEVLAILKGRCKTFPPIILWGGDTESSTLSLGDGGVRKKFSDPQLPQFVAGPLSPLLMSGPLG